MEPNYEFYSNYACDFFPCHYAQNKEDFNCLFCYCPLYSYADCPGSPRYQKGRSGKTFKDCSNCTFPHKPENYERIVEILSERA